MIVDVYHSLNVVPFSIQSLGLEDAFIIGGGYKYCQLGEGNCFLRFPKTCQLRPVITGWFSEFSSLEENKPEQKVDYGKDYLRLQVPHMILLVIIVLQKYLIFFVSKNLQQNCSGK